jgi:hypothetical protein
MSSYPLSLALQNFMPVLLSAAALWNFGRMLARDGATSAAAASIAMLLIVLGGSMKAFWKLLMSMWNIDVPLLSVALFPLIAPGFALLALTVLRVRASRAKLAIAAIVAVLLGSAVSATAGVTMWKMPLLTLLTTAMLACAIGLVRRARAERDSLSTVLVLTYTLTSFGLSGIAAAGAGSLSLQWTEQIVSTLGASALLWAAWRMRAAAAEKII